ncbi:MAG: aminoglycoside phosphotransferase family protein [Myxococcota bacterium]
MNPLEPPVDVLDAWDFRRATLTPIALGHINRTFLLEQDDKRFVMQRVSPIFGPEIHDDIEAVTERLTSRGVATPRLVPTRDGRRFLESEGLWRVLTYAPGHTFLRVGSADVAASAARLLARFHRALLDFDYRFKNRRSGIHDTDRHLENLRQTVESAGSHPNAEAVHRLTYKIEKRVNTLPSLSHLPDRVTHGDPKISNVLFDARGEACCLVDLDTLGRMSLVHELGDALRSWCNRGDEDGRRAHFDSEIFGAAIRAYVAEAGPGFCEDELPLVIDGVELIALELASRFAADAVNESYFAWDRERFDSAGAHNLQRAENQWSLATSVREQRAGLEAIVAELTR